MRQTLLNRSCLVALIVLAAMVGTGLGCARFRGAPKVQFLVVEVQTNSGNADDAVTRTIMVLRKRLNAVGVTGASVERQPGGAGNRILIELPSVPDYERVKRLILAQAKLEFREVFSPPSPAPVAKYLTEEEAKRAAPDGEVLPYRDRISDGEEAKSSVRFVALVKGPLVTGEHIRSAQAVSPAEGEYQIVFSLTREGAERFGVWTGSHINSYLAVALNGEVKSIVYIKSQISDSGQIDGKFSQAEAEDLALALRSGALPGTVTLAAEGVYAVNAH